MASLQEQLLKAGMVDKKKAKEIEKQKRKQSKQQIKQTPKGQKIVSESQNLAQKALEEKHQRSIEHNKQQQAIQEKKAIAAQIQQLIERHKIDRKNGDQAYQFTHGTKIKKIYVTSQVHDQLSRGFVAIVHYKEGYEIVPKLVAEKIQQRDELSLVILNQNLKDEGADEDDPYAEYKIPDDLMW